MEEANVGTTVTHGPNKTDSDCNEKKVFVGNLPFSADKKDLERLFSPFGTVIGVNLRLDRKTNKPKGFAFITFEDSSSASAAQAALHGHVMEGRTLSVNRALLRGLKDSDALEEEEDMSWKTAPPPRPKAAQVDRKTGMVIKPAISKGKKGSSSSSTASGSNKGFGVGKVQKGWDEWAGPK